MKQSSQTSLPLGLMASACVVMGAAGVGLVLGYGFGVRAGGSSWVGVVAALCGATFLSLLVDGVLSRLARQKR